MVETKKRCCSVFYNNNRKTHLQYNRFERYKKAGSLFQRTGSVCRETRGGQKYRLDRGLYFGTPLRQYVYIFVAGIIKQLDRLFNFVRRKL